MQITLEWLRAQRACYLLHATDAQRAILDLLPAGGAPLDEVLRCEAVPPADRVWVAAQALPAASRRRWLGRLVRRALGRVESPDPESLAILPYLDAGDPVPYAAAAAASSSAAAAAAYTAADYAAAYTAADYAAAYTAADYAASSSSSSSDAAYDAYTAAYIAADAAAHAAAAHAAAHATFHAAYAAGRESENKAQVADALEVLRG